MLRSKPAIVNKRTQKRRGIPCGDSPPRIHSDAGSASRPTETLPAKLPHQVLDALLVVVDGLLQRGGLIQLESDVRHLGLGDDGEDGVKIQLVVTVAKTNSP